MSAVGGDPTALGRVASRSTDLATDVRTGAAGLDAALDALRRAAPTGWAPRLSVGGDQLRAWADALRANAAFAGEVGAALAAADAMHRVGGAVAASVGDLDAFVAARVDRPDVAGLAAPVFDLVPHPADAPPPGAAGPDHLVGAPGRHGDPGSGAQGDPVDTATGHLWRVDEDVLVLSAAGPFEVARTYSSAERRVGLFGRGWWSLLDVRLQRDGDGLVLHADDGWRLRMRELDGVLVGPAGATTTLVATDGGHEALLADGTRWRFDARGLLAAVVRAGGAWRATRDVDGVRWASDDGRVVTAVVRDGLVTRVEAGGTTVRYVHDQQVLQRVVHPDRTVRYRHDDAGRLATVASGDRTLLTTTYDASGRVVRQRDALGGRWRFAHRAGRTEVTHPSGVVVTDTHEDGVLVARTRDGVPVADVRRPVPRPLVDRLVAELRDAGAAGGRVVARDDHGRPATLVRSAGSIALAWGEDDRVAAARVRPATGVDVDVTTTPTDDGGVRRQVVAGGVHGHVARDRWGDLVAWGSGTDVWRLERDVLRRPVRLTAPDGGATTWTHDADGALAERDAPGGTTTVATDVAGRPTRLAEPHREVTLRWGTHGPEALDLGGGRVEVVRDAAGRPTAIATPHGRHTLAWRDGRLVGGTDPGAGRWAVERDTAAGTRTLRRDAAPDVTLDTGGDRPWLVVEDLRVAPAVATGTTWLGERGSGGDVVVACDLPARTFTQRLPNGVEVTASYDRAGRLATQAAVGPDGTELFAEALGHDAAGRTVAWRHGDADWALAHDANGRLVAVDGGPQGSWSASWDRAGRRVAGSSPDAAWTAELDDRGLVRAIVPTDDDVPGGHGGSHGPGPAGGAEGAGRRQLVHDDGGRVVADGGWRFAHDATGRLVRAAHEQRGLVVEHDLDVRGLRVATRVRRDGVLQRDLRWSWDLGHRVPRPLLVVDRVTGRRALCRYDAVGHPAGVVDPDDATRTRWFVTDHRGTPRVVLDADGRVTATHGTSPWGGDTRPAPLDDTAPLVTFGHAGAVVDPGTGHLHLLARQYDPGIARFLGPDPVQTPIGVHHQDPYGYCDGRPLELRDPDGRWGISLPNPLDVLDDVVDTVGDAAGAVADGVGEVVDTAGDVAGAAVDAVGDGIAAVDRFWDANQHWLAPTLAVVGIVGMTLATAGLAPTLATAFTVAGMAGSAVSAADNIGEGNYAGAALDVVALGAGGSSLGVLDDGASLLGRSMSGSSVFAVGDDAARVAQSEQVANLLVGNVNTVLFGVGHAVDGPSTTACPPA